MSLIYQHADDTTLTLADKDSIFKTFEVLELYGNASGAKINVEKSEVLVINENKDSLSNLKLPVTVKESVIEVLGIHLGVNKEICEKMN